MNEEGMREEVGTDRPTEIKELTDNTQIKAQLVNQNTDISQL